MSVGIEFWDREWVRGVAPYIVGESVLHLGCGFTMLADAINIAYRGVDVGVAVYEWNKDNVKNPKASFGIVDVYHNLGTHGFDTVLLGSIFEQAIYPAWLCQIAIRAAIERVIVTVPTSDQRWCREELNALLHGIDKIEKFGGPNNDRWVMAIKDRNKEERLAHRWMGCYAI